MLMSSRSPGSRLLRNAVQPRHQHRRLEQIGIGRAVEQPQLEPAGIGDANHVGAVVAGIGDGVGRPGRARERHRRIDALVAVDRRNEDRAQRSAACDHAAQEVLAERRNAELALRVGEKVASFRPERDMGVAAVAGQVENGFGMKVARRPCFSAIVFDHVFEEDMAVGGHRAIVIAQFISNWPFASSWSL